MCDDSWLNIEENHTNGYNPFAWGHLINHKNASNVMYFEYCYPEDMPHHYKAYVPNIYYNGSHHMVSPTWFFFPLSSLTLQLNILHYHIPGEDNSFVGHKNH